MSEIDKIELDECIVTMARIQEVIEVLRSILIATDYCPMCGRAIHEEER